MVSVLPLFLVILAEGAPRTHVYECDVLPELCGWERILADTPGAVRSIMEGWFVEAVGLPEGWPGPDGDAEFYRVSLSEFANVPTFFIEWRAVTDNPSWLLELSQVPAVLSAGGNGAFYHTTMTDAAVQLFRGTAFPLVIPSVEPHVAHTYRVELRGSESFMWYIDNAAVEGGIPRNSYPDPTSVLIWGVRRSYVDSTTRWDYIRFGVIPVDGSGDYDSDGAATLFDHYFVRECIAEAGPNVDAGPGCRFTDFDGDTDADLLDFAEFQNLFGPVHP